MVAKAGVEVHRTHECTGVGHPEQGEGARSLGRLRGDERVALVRIAADLSRTGANSIGFQAWRTEDDHRWRPGHWGEADGLSILRQGGRLAVRSGAGSIHSQQ